MTQSRGKHPLLQRTIRFIWHCPISQVMKHHFHPNLFNGGECAEHERLFTGCLFRSGKIPHPIFRHNEPHSQDLSRFASWSFFIFRSDSDFAQMNHVWSSGSKTNHVFHHFYSNNFDVDSDGGHRPTLRRSLHFRLEGVSSFSAEISHRHQVELPFLW